MDLHHESARVCQFEEADVIFLQPDIRDEFGPGSVDPPSFVRFPQAQPAVPIPVVALQQEAEAPWLGQETCRSVLRAQVQPKSAKECQIRRSASDQWFIPQKEGKFIALYIKRGESLFLV